jgi:phage terminase large subunit GpA-like protein
VRYSPAVYSAFAPPPKLQLSTWMEEHIRLPAGDAAVPGKIRLYGYQRGIADAIGDPLIERVTVIKSARIGYTTLLVGALANYVHNDPSSLLCLLPVKDDARNFVVSQVEPVFAESPVVRAKLDAPKSHAHDRDTMLFRRFTGGSLRVVSAEAQRNLRSHAARILIVDEADACGTHSRTNVCSRCLAPSAGRSSSSCGSISSGRPTGLRPRRVSVRTARH